RCHAPLAGRRLARAGPLHTPPRPGRQTPRGHPAWHGASTPPDAAVNRLDCKKRPTLRGRKGSTNRPWRAPSAAPQGLPWLLGRPEAAGAAHATATIWTICCAVKVAGVPERG